MPAGKVDRNVLSSNYQQPGDIYQDGKTEGAFEVVAQQIDENYDYAKSIDDYTKGLVTSGTLSPLPPDFLYRQAIINGNFDIWQRGTSFSFGSTGYSCDRWQTLRYGGGTATVERAEITDLPGSRYCVRIKNTGTTTAPIHLAQPIETEITKKLIGKKLTLSFQARKGSNVTAFKVAASICYSTDVDSGQVNAFTTLKTIEIFGGLTTQFTNFSLKLDTPLINTAATIAVKFVIEYNAGANSGVNDYIDIAQVQLTANDGAFPFQPRSFGEELVLCQRYYEKSYGYNVVPGSNSAPNYGMIGIAQNTDIAQSNIRFVVKKRTTPTITLFHSDGTSGAVGKTATNVKVTTVSSSNIGDGGVGNVSKIAGFTTGESVQGHWTADSEL